MHLFGEKGYDATYILNLIETKGISRSILYDSFEDKDALFKLVLEHYKNFGALLYRIHVLFLLSRGEMGGNVFWEAYL